MEEGRVERENLTQMRYTPNWFIVDRYTERNRETEGQRDGDTTRQIGRETERQRGR